MVTENIKKGLKMIPAVFAQLSLNPSNQGLFGLGGENLGQGLFGSNLDGGLFSGVLMNVLSSGGEGNNLENINLEDLSPEELAALEHAQSNALELGNDDEQALLQITQIITVVYEELTVLSKSGIDFDNLNDTQELAAAYMQKGMSAEEANNRAARLTIMMLVMDNRISMEDLMQSLSSPQAFGLEQAHQKAFLSIEQTITKFTLASTGSSITSLADSIRNGVSLEGALNNASGNAPQNAEKAMAILEELSAQSQNTSQQSASKAGEQLINNDGSSQQNIFSKSFGRMENLLSALADEAAKSPQGAELSQQLRDMAGAVKRISQNVVREGGLQQLEANAVQDIDAPVQEEAQQNIKAQVSEKQVLPERVVSERPSQDIEKSENKLNRNQNTVGTNSNAQQLGGSEQKLVEPQAPTYVVRPSATGGVEVVNPQTGEVIQTANPAQTAGTQSFNSNTGEASATLTQSRGLEAALQARLNQQVSVHVRNLATHGGGQINVGLNPPEMGRVQVRLEILDGSVKGAITVQRPDVADSIARDIRALENAFKEMGLELSQEGISVQLEQNPADQEKENNTQQQNSGTTLASTRVDAGSQDQEEQTWVNPDRLLDVRA